ncbi:MAG: chlorite dismutase family protein [Bacteroidia bacterium]
MDKRILVHYQTFSFSESFWMMERSDKRKLLREFIKAAREVCGQAEFYQLYPAAGEWDLMLWSSNNAEDKMAPDQYFRSFAGKFNALRSHILPGRNFWGMTKPSVYSKARRSPQEIDPFDTTKRTPYFIIYPFSKTPEWYMKSREERQEMMNAHITLGKKYKEINQLLLYSFGLQDQEFIVSYEMESLAQFSDLVYDLRMTEARLFTLLDTPIITALRREEDDLMDLYC